MTQPAQSSDYCAKCHLMILQPNVNYGINPDAVCKCPSAPAQRAAQPQEVPAPTEEDQLGICGIYREAHEEHPFCVNWHPLAASSAPTEEVGKPAQPQEVPAEQRGAELRHSISCKSNIGMGTLPCDCTPVEFPAQPASAAKPRTMIVNGEEMEVLKHTETNHSTGKTKTIYESPAAKPAEDGLAPMEEVMTVTGHSFLGHPAYGPAPEDGLEEQCQELAEKLHKIWIISSGSGHPIYLQEGAELIAALIAAREQAGLEALTPELVERALQDRACYDINGDLDSTKLCEWLISQSRAAEEHIVLLNQRHLADGEKLAAAEEREGSCERSCWNSRNPQTICSTPC